MAKTKVTIVVQPGVVISIETEGILKVHNTRMSDDPGYETEVRTFEDEEEGILYDNLD